MGMRALWAAVLLAIAALGAGPAAAQTIKPLDVEQDPNGVDLFSGQARVRLPELSVPGSSNLRLTLLQNFQPIMNGRLLPNTIAQATYQVNGGGAESAHFDCDDNFDCLPKKRNGSAFFADPYSKQFLYIEGGTGTRIFFDLQNGPQDPITASNGFSFSPSWIKYANGEQLSFTYDVHTTSTGQKWRRPTTIVSNLGYTMVLTYQNNAYDAGWSTVAQATIFKSDNMAAPLARLTYSGSTVTDLAGREWTCVYCHNGLAGTGTSTITSLRLPGESTDTFQADPGTCSGTSNPWGVSQVTTEGVAYNYSWIPNTTDCQYLQRVTISAPLGFSRTINILSSHQIRPRVTSVVDSLSRTTSYEYDNHVRVTRVTYPEGNAASVAYDMIGNITEARRIAKPGSGLADSVETAYFGGAGLHCIQVTCFRPVWTRDALNRQTDYTWDSAHGGMLTKTEPADANGQRRRTIIEYETVNGLSRPIRERTCFVNASGASLTCGTAQEQVKQTAYWGNTLLPLTETVTDGSATQALTTTYSYDPAGRLLSADGPLPGTDDASYFRYDDSGRKTWEIGPLGSDGYRAATRTTYRPADDQPTEVETGVVLSPSDTVLTVLGEQRHVYDTRRLKVRTTAADGTDQGVTQFSYDARNRAECTAVRMNPAVWGSLPASACTPGTQGSAGPDRITRQAHDSESRVTTVQQAYGTPIQQNYAAYTYTLNGQLHSVTDANGNRAEMRYDGHDRQTRWYFPSPGSAGQINLNDYEKYDYDLAGNRVSLRRRDGLTTSYQYDALNRMIVKVVPERQWLSAHHTRDVYYGYDVGDRQLYARFDSHSGEGVNNSYDSLGRLTGSTTTLHGVSRTLGYTLDAGGRRTQLTYPDGLAVSYSYDAAGRMQAIYEGATGSTNALWTYSYSDYGRRVRRTARHGQYLEAQADGLGRMTSLATDLAGTANDNTTGFVYNPAMQIGSRTISNNAYAWTEHAEVDRAYAVNGLNQYTSAGPGTLSYDANGNLVADGNSGYSYGYDNENRLVSEWQATNVHLRYDPLGRLYQTWSQSTGHTRFLYDGDELVGEYDYSGNLLRRYVHGAAVDDPLVWYEGSGFADPRWLTADHQGSIVGISQASGTLKVNSYDPYGIPAAGNVGRFQYTGQAWIPELGMYYYKARIYSPTLGRFLQTDSIGYEDQMNLYAYARNDPINLIDPAGERATVSGTMIHIVPETPGVPRVSIPNTVRARGIRPVGDFHRYMVHTRTTMRNPATIGAGFRGNPTPGYDDPATSDGTRNNVGHLIPLDGGTNFVRSFSVPSPDPSRYTDIIVNYTVRGEHALGEGYVMGYGERNRDGTYTLRHYGEGNAPLQAQILKFLWGPQAERAWKSVQRQIMNATGGRQPCSHGRAGSCGGGLEVWN